ncbi:MAG: polyphosphate kinase 1 [Ruminococcus sp.]|nr:polyphosphate kinase 1 [Ruminococcus sp.]
MLSIQPKLYTYDNRELSWLKFNKRVLEEAVDENVPLLEGLRFEAIFSSNLDEFFMVRVGSLVNASLTDDGDRDSKTGMRPGEQINEICNSVKNLCILKDKYVSDTFADLSNHGIVRYTFDMLSAKQEEYVKRYFQDKIEPQLKVHILKNNLPFPFFENKKLYLVCSLYKNGEPAIGIASFSDSLDRVLRLESESDSFEYILIEDILLGLASECFNDYGVDERTIARVTRSADVNVDEDFYDQENPRTAMQMLLLSRNMLSIVRLQLSNKVSQLFLDKLAEQFSLEKRQIFFETAPLDLSFVTFICKENKQHSELFYPPLSPRRPSFDDQAKSIYQIVTQGDVLLCYPYESFEPFIRMLREAAEDENVISIKITLYRTANNSEVIKALCNAAKNGKRVTACVELRARFDEQHNLIVTEQLEKAGCTVIHGIKGYKVHSKICLITRKFESEESNITQIGTGNYNESTAKAYTDFSLITADDEIANDAKAVFKALENSQLPQQMHTLMVSPNSMRQGILAKLDEQINISKQGGSGYFGGKMNGLTDKALIDKIIEASIAGVKIELIVRGACCLKAGVPQITDNVKIISIVGRFLEHARIYIFGVGNDCKVYISSADLMTRNTCRRVEAAAPIKDPKIKQRIIDYFNIQMSDTLNAREQKSNGEYIRVSPKVKINSQQQLFESAYEHEPKLDETNQEKTKKKGFFARLFNLLKRKNK